MIRRMLGRRVVAGAVVAAMITGASPGAWAQSQGERTQEQLEELEQLAQESLERLMLALENMLQGLPQYELPEITENGDIIIRRVPPRAGRDGEPAPADDEMDET